MNSRTSTIQDWARGVTRVVVFSGAGISTDSGIPDFRGPQGAWTLNPGLQARHTYRAFLAEPGLRVSYWQSRAESPAWDAEPNAGHLAVVALAEAGIDTVVVTQNTDGLHQRAGTPADRVFELHGTMHVTQCVSCDYRAPTTDILKRIAQGEEAPPCPVCGGILKTASTMFGQTMNPGTFAGAEDAVTSCDLVLAVGTTLMVEPAGSMCATAVRAGARLVIINRDPTPYDGIASALIRDPIADALPVVVEQIKAASAAERAPGAPGAPGAAGASGTAGRAAEDSAVGAELAALRNSARERGLGLPAQAVDAAVVTALLCGAADESAALEVLGHIEALKEAGLRSRAAAWLRDAYPPEAAGDAAPYWDQRLPDARGEELIVALVTSRFLLKMHMESTHEQDVRSLTVLARAAQTRPAVNAVLTELISLLPGLSPAAVGAALTGGYPEPLAEALMTLVKNAALPAELLDEIPRGTTVLGDFPVLLAESLVSAYEHRAQTENGRKGLTKTLIELAHRLADTGRASEALGAARRAVTQAAQLADPGDCVERAATALSRAETALGGAGNTAQN
ncbi:MAG TPA: Sir2 family NAD-dependent protein deacetylase [Streptosporangiaceae bacterium]|nr:Sir2 family NAD-dependent protein deacetylase [Streptosporangiaceae bacterium]